MSRNFKHQIFAGCDVNIQYNNKLYMMKWYNFDTRIHTYNTCDDILNIIYMSVLRLIVLIVNFYSSCKVGLI